MRGPRSSARAAIRPAAVTVAICVSLLSTVGTAYGACHAFTVEASPSQPTEGETVTVTIRRDAAVRPSSVRVRTTDQTATGGADYSPLDERVEFTGQTELTRTVEIFDDDTAEEAEVFVIELSEGQGCEVNPNFTYDSTTATIRDDDAPVEESPAPTDDQAQDEPTAGHLPDTGAGALIGLGSLGVLAGAIFHRRCRNVGEPGRCS